MTNEKINILFCLDHRFSLPVTVLIDSLIRNCQQKDSAETNYEMNIFLYSERKYLSKIQNYIKSHLMSKIQSALTDNKLSQMLLTAFLPKFPNTYHLQHFIDYLLLMICQRKLTRYFFLTLIFYVMVTFLNFIILMFETAMRL